MSEVMTLEKLCVPFCCYSEGVGACAQAKQGGWMLDRFPGMWSFYCTGLQIQNDATLKDFTVDSPVTELIHVNKVPKLHLRIYRTCGQFNPHKPH